MDPKEKEPRTLILGEYTYMCPKGTFKLLFRGFKPKLGSRMNLGMEATQVKQRRV